MQQKVSVVLPNRETIFCTKMVTKCPLEIDDVILEAYLLVFELLGLNAILGSDCFFRHFEIIDCRQRMVLTFRVPGWKIEYFETIGCDQCRE